jgi:hypothetical protein
MLEGPLRARRRSTPGCRWRIDVARSPPTGCVYAQSRRSLCGLSSVPYDLRPSGSYNVCIDSNRIQSNLFNNAAGVITEPHRKYRTRKLAALPLGVPNTPPGGTLPPLTPALPSPAAKARGTSPGPPPPQILQHLAPTSCTPAPSGSPFCPSPAAWPPASTRVSSGAAAAAVVYLHMLAVFDCGVSQRVTRLPPSWLMQQAASTSSPSPLTTPDPGHAGGGPDQTSWPGDVDNRMLQGDS